jgi:hypothetical protein
MYNGMPQGCCLAALARTGWSNLGLDDILLGRQSLLQEAASSTLKVKKRKKMWERKREIKATFKWERKCYELDQYSLQPLLHLLFKFMLMWDGNIPLPPLLMPWGVAANPKLYTQLYKVAWRRWRWPWWWWSKVSWPKEDSRTLRK